MNRSSQAILEYLNFAHVTLGIETTSVDTPVDISQTDRHLAQRLRCIEINLNTKNLKKGSEIVFNQKSASALSFCFVSNRNDLENLAQSQLEMLKKMALALKPTVIDILIFLVSEFEETEFFVALTQKSSQLNLAGIVVFRDDSVNGLSAFRTLEEIPIIETVNPLREPDNQERKREVWSQFKVLMRHLK